MVKVELRIMEHRTAFSIRFAVAWPMSHTAQLQVTFLPLSSRTGKLDEA